MNANGSSRITDKLPGACRVLALALLLIFLSAPSAKLGGQPLNDQTVVRDQCESRVYLYIDVSRSLGKPEKDYLSRALGRLLSAENTKSAPIAYEKIIKVIPFSDRLAKAETISEGNAEESLGKILKDRRGYKDENDNNLDRSQSNIIEVIKSIQELTDPGGGLSGSHVVFMIASDFVHDDTSEDTEASRELDQEHWDKSKGKLLESLHDVFDSGSPPVLLLLPTPSSEADSLGRQVIEDLRRLVPYDSQVHPIGEGELDLRNLIRFLRPLLVEYSVDKEAEKLKVNISNRCFQLGKAHLGAKTSTVKLGVLPDDLCDFRENHGCEKYVGALGGAPWPPTGEIIINLDFFEVKGQVKGLKEELVPLPSVNLAEYLFLSSLNLRVEPWRRRLEGSAQISSVLWRGEDATLSFDLLKEGESAIGSDTVHLKAPQEKDPTPRHEALSVDMAVDSEKLAKICLDKAPNLKLQVQAPENLWIQKKLIDVDVEHYEEEDFLEKLIHDGSIPAFLTLFTIYLMAFRSRDLELARVHEILGVAGFWAILLFLLRRIPWFDSKIEAYVLEPKSNLISIAIGIMLVLVGWVMLTRGSLGPARDREEIRLELAIEELKAREAREGGMHLPIFFLARWWRKLVKSLARRPPFQSLPRFARVVFVLVVPAAAVILMIAFKPAPSCRLKVVDDFSASDEAQVFIGVKPPVQGGDR